MFCSAQASRLVSFVTHTMTNRIEVLDMIHGVMSRVRNAPSREQRFNLLENAQMLADILKEVTQYENSLLMDLDVD